MCLTSLSGARSRAKHPDWSFLSVSAPALRRTIAVSPKITVSRGRNATEKAGGGGWYRTKKTKIKQSTKKNKSLRKGVAVDKHGIRKRMAHTVSFGNGMVQGGLARVVRCVQGTAVLEEQSHYRSRADGCRSVDGVLATLIPDTSRCRW